MTSFQTVTAFETKEHKGWGVIPTVYRSYLTLDGYPLGYSIQGIQSFKIGNRWLNVGNGCWVDLDDAKLIKISQQVGAFQVGWVEIKDLVKTWE